MSKLNTMLPPPPPSIRLSRTSLDQANENVEQNGSRRTNLSSRESPAVQNTVEVIDLEDEYDQEMDESLFYPFFEDEEKSDPLSDVVTIDDTFTPHVPFGGSSPTFSVIEVPVPPKPPPEVVDLLDESHIVENEKGIEETLKETVTALLTRDYPGNSRLPSISDVERICCPLITEYKVKGVQTPKPYGSPQLGTIVTNYFQHMLKNRRELDNLLAKFDPDSKSDRIAETVWCAWSARNELNDKIEDRIRQYPSTPDEVKTNILQPKDNWKEMLPFLIDGKTELQSILIPKFSLPLPTAAIMNTDLIWKCQWSPLNLSVSFELFVKTVCVLKRFGSISLLQKLRLFKKWYIEYMNIVASSDQEFLMAVITAFGTDLKGYPGKIWDYFQSRKMLVEIPETNDTANTGRQKRAHSVEEINTLNSALENPLDKTSGSGECRRSIPDIANLERYFGFLPQQFEDVFQAIHMDFTGQYLGNRNSRDLFNKWYRSFGYRLFEHTTALSSAVAKLAAEALRSEASRKNKLLPPVRKLTKTEIFTWRSQLKPEIEEQRAEAITNNPALLHLPSSKAILMESGSSLFQMSLVKDKDTTHLIPSRNKWNPLNCVLPFGLFKAFFRAKVNKSDDFVSLHDDKIKVRYVELLWEYFNADLKQVLLGIFSAVGPDPNDVPLRILQVLQQTGLFRSDLNLPRLSNEALRLPPAGNLKNIESSNLNQHRKRGAEGVTCVLQKVSRPDQGPVANGNQSSIATTQFRPPPPRPIDTPDSSCPAPLLQSPFAFAIPAPRPARPIGPPPTLFAPNPSQVAHPSSGDNPSVMRVPQSTDCHSQNDTPLGTGTPPPLQDPPPISAPPVLDPPPIGATPPSGNDDELSEQEWTAVATKALTVFNMQLTTKGSEETYQSYKGYCQTPQSNTDSVYYQGILAGITLARKFYAEEESRKNANSTPNWQTRPPLPQFVVNNFVTTNNHGGNSFSFQRPEAVWPTQRFRTVRPRPRFAPRQRFMNSNNFYY